MHDRLSYERSSQEFLAEEHAAAKAALPTLTLTPNPLTLTPNP